MKPDKNSSQRICPACGKSLLGKGNFCYSCCSFLKEDFSDVLTPNEITDQEIFDLIKLS